MLMRAFRQLQPGEEDNFAIMTSDALVDIWDQLTGVISAVSSGSSVGFHGCGWCSHYEYHAGGCHRKNPRDWIRKSVGARSQDILNQFLVESSMLAASGGVIGVLLATALTLLGDSLTSVPDVGADNGCRCRSGIVSGGWLVLRDLPCA